MSKTKVLAIIGKSGSGKDTIKKYLLSTYAGKVCSIVNTTTRPMRSNEVNGIDYNFVNEDNFWELADSNLLTAIRSFNGWHYGIDIGLLNPMAVNICIIDLKGLESLIELSNELDIMVLYVNANDKVRLMRALDREENPNCSEICRRYFADEQDFSILLVKMRKFENKYTMSNNGNDICEIRNSIPTKILDFIKYD